MLDGNTKDIKKIIDNHSKESLVHMKTENNAPKKSRETSADADNSDKINLKKLEGKGAEIIVLSQLIEDAYRNLQIAFAEDLYLYCQANVIDFTQLRAAINTKWNVNVPHPGTGIVGYSIGRQYDSDMLLNPSSLLSGSKIIEAIIAVNYEYERNRNIADDDVL
jgi:hypothetical protein